MPNTLGFLLDMAETIFAVLLLRWMLFVGQFAVIYGQASAQAVGPTPN